MKSLKQINQLLKEDLLSSTIPPRRRTEGLLRGFKIILIFVLAALGIFYGRPTHLSPLPLPEKQVAHLVKQVLPLNLDRENELPEMNILALGRPGPGYPGEDLTDTIIVGHLNAQGKKLILISLPRDLLVKIPGQESFTRINQLYSLGGIEMTKQKIEEISGLAIDDYILVDLVAVKEVIELVDGLNIFVPQDIYDDQFPGPNYSYQTFSLKAGWRYLDGETALQYIRTRHSGAGDFDRMWRQQQVLRALKQKVTGLSLLWDFTTYWKIFNTLREHIQTSLGLSQMHSLWRMSQEIETNQITHLAIDNRSGLLGSGQIILDGQPASILWPRAGRENYSEIQELIKAAID